MKFCQVCGKKFVPIKGKNLCCKKCGWSCIDAIISGKAKYDCDTGKKG